MAAIIKPSRQVLFTDLAKLDPRAFPADRLDSQIQNLIDAIHSTQVALAEVRRDDGQLRMPPGQTRERADLSRLEGKLIETSAAVAGAAAEVSKTSRDVHLRVKDAEIAAFTSVNSLAAVERQGATAKSTFDDAENAADRSEYYATQSQNSANYSKAQTDNAISANVQATQWAEYLAGPVVNPADAPAYAAGHPFGHGLYYQPVEGGTAGLWSAKWWALYAQQLVGSWNFYYLGSWATPPVPGASNPATGVSVPSPLEPGSFYYNTELHQLFVWDGTQWAPPYVQVLTPGYQNSFVYVAIAGQTAFSGPDMHGRVPDVGNNPSDVHVAGLRLLYGSQYTVNATSNVLTLVTPATSGTVVQWDLLIPQADDVGGIVLRKVALTPVPDGVNLTFSMTWMNPELGYATGGRHQRSAIAGDAGRCRARAWDRLRGYRRYSDDGRGAAGQFQVLGPLVCRGRAGRAAASRSAGQHLGADDYRAGAHAYHVDGDAWRLVRRSRPDFCVSVEERRRQCRAQPDDVYDGGGRRRQDHYGGGYRDQYGGVRQCHVG